MFSFAKSEYCEAYLFDESPVKNVPADRPPIQWHTRVLGPVQQKTYLYPMLLSQIADTLLVSYMLSYLQSYTHFFVSVREFHCIFFSRHKISSYFSRHLLTSTKG